MIPAEAAIPFMTLRRSMLGRKIPFRPARRGQRAGPRSVTHVRDPNFDEPDVTLGSLVPLKPVPSENAKGIRG
jgi:hypothetical protein